MFGFTSSYAFCFTKRLTQIFVDCSRFNKGEINEVRIEYRNKSRTDRTKTKLNEITLITFEAIVLKLIYNTLAADLHQVT